jgi:hypothetical protein
MFRREVWHAILRVLIVDVLASLDEFRAISTAAHVLVASAIDATGGLECVAVGSAVLASTCSAGICVCRAVLRYMVVLLTFGASDGLFFVLADVDVFAGYAESFS